MALCSGKSTKPSGIEDKILINYSHQLDWLYKYIQKQVYSSTKNKSNETEIDQILCSGQSENQRYKCGSSLFSINTVLFV